MSVELILLAGSDLDVVNGARISFDVEHKTLTDADKGLIRRLVADGHTEPLRGVWAKFKVTCSIGCARQIMTNKRHMAINERSTRYSEFSDEFVMPTLKRQVGKAMDYQYEPLATVDRDIAASVIEHAYREAHAKYRWLVTEAGIAKEDARSVLPLGMQTALIVSGDLVAWLRFLSRRTDPHAQDEIREIAHEIEAQLRQAVPVTLDAWDAAGRRAL